MSPWGMPLRDVLTMILAANAIDHLTAYASSGGGTNCDRKVATLRQHSLFWGIAMEIGMESDLQTNRNMRRRRVKRFFWGCFQFESHGLINIIIYILYTCCDALLKY